jgi:hypothetical protein
VYTSSRIALDPAAVIGLASLTGAEVRQRVEAGRGLLGA